MTPMKFSEVHLHVVCCITARCLKPIHKDLFFSNIITPKRNWFPRTKAVKNKMQTTHKRKHEHTKSKEDSGNTVLLPVLSTILQYRFNTAAIKSKYIREKCFERSEKTGKKTEGVISQLFNGLKISVRVWCEISAPSDKIALKKSYVDSWDTFPHIQKTPPWAFGLAR